MNKLIRFIYGSEPLEMVFDVPIDIAVNRLRSSVSRTGFSRLKSQRMVGSVKPNRVAIQRVIPLVQNSFKPIFVGSFESYGSETRLSGILRFHRLIQILMTFWLVFLCLWILLSLVAAFAVPDKAWFFPFAGLTMVGLGVGLVKVGRWFSRNDKDWLEVNITNAVNKS